MGRGNCLVCSDVGGQWYIDNADLYVYRSLENDEVVMMRDIPYHEIDQYDFDEYETECFENEVVDELKRSLIQRFPCFVEVDGWFDGNSGRRERHSILESKLFCIALEDNQWSLAVELIPKEDPWDEPWIETFQRKHFQKYLDGIKEALFEQFEYVSYRSSAWTSGTLRRECAAS